MNLLNSIINALSPSEPKVYKIYNPDGKGDFDVIYMSQPEIDRTCRKLGTTTSDEGKSLKDKLIAACYDYKQKILWTSTKRKELIAHELCHRANPPTLKEGKWIYKNNCANKLPYLWNW